MSESPKSGSLLGARVGACTLRDLIDDGGAGAVWRGEDAHGTPWAVKTFALAPEPQAFDDLQARFELLRAIQHPNLVELKELVRIDEGRAAVVMGHLYGQSMATELASRGRVALDGLLPVLRQILAGLERLHQGHDEEPAVLGALSPSRVFLQDNGTVKLLTVAATPYAAAETIAEERDAPWCAPELLQGYAAGPAADLFSTAAVAYACLCGEPPFPGASADAVAAAQLRARGRPLEPPSRRAPAGQVSDRLDDVLLKGLALNPDERYASALVMLRAIKRLRPHAGDAAAAAGGHPTLLALGQTGAGKTTWLAAAYRELAGKQGPLSANPTAPEDRDYLEAHLEALRAGRFPEPTAYERPRRLEFTVVRRGSRLGPFSFMDYAGRLAEHVTPERPGALPTLIGRDGGLLILLDPEKLAQPEARTETLNELRSAADAIVAELVPPSEKARKVKLETPVALVTTKADLLAGQAEIVKARSAVRGAARSLRAYLRPHFSHIGMFEVSCVDEERAQDVLRPLQYLLGIMRPTFLRRARPVIAAALIVFSVLVLLLGGWSTFNYRQLTQRHAAIFADRALSLNDQMKALAELLEAEGDRMLLGRRGKFHEELAELLAQRYEPLQKQEAAGLEIAHGAVAEAPAGYPESLWRKRWLAYDAQWNPKSGAASARLLVLLERTGQQYHLLWCAERQKERYDELARRDERLQLEYLKINPEPASGVITAPAAIEYFRRRHPWPEVRDRAIALLEQGGPAGLPSCRRLLDGHLDIFRRAGVAPAKEARDWSAGLDLVREKRGELEKFDRQRRYARAHATLDELLEQTPMLPRQAVGDLVARRDAYAAWSEMKLGAQNLGELETRQAASEKLQQFLAGHPPEKLAGTLATDAPLLRQTFETTLPQAPSPERLRLRLDELQLTAAPVAWKLLLDVTWEESIKPTAKALRRVAIDIQNNRNADSGAAVERTLAELTADCRRYLKWDGERLALEEKLSAGDGELDEFDALDDELDGADEAVVFDPKRAQFCQNLTYQADKWKNRPPVTGEISAESKKKQRYAVALTQTDEAPALDTSETEWTAEPLSFTIPAAPVDWRRPLRFEAAVEVDYLLRNKTYRVRLDVAAAGPLALLRLDERNYKLKFKNGDETILGEVEFGDNFSLPYLLDPERLLP